MGIYIIFSGLDLDGGCGKLAWTPRPCRGCLERWKTGFRAIDRASAADDVSSLRRALQGRAQGQELHVPRAVPHHVLCAADLPRESARYRGLPARAAR